MRNEWTKTEDIRYRCPSLSVSCRSSQWCALPCLTFKLSSDWDWAWAWAWDWGLGIGMGMGNLEWEMGMGKWKWENGNGK